jgi:hypothetical protein
LKLIISQRYWRNLYHRFDSHLNPNERFLDQLSILNNNTYCLNEYSRAIEKKCAALKLLLKNKEGENTPSLPVSMSSSSLAEEVNKLAIDDQNDSNSFDLEKLIKYKDSLKFDWKSSRNSCSCSHLYDYSLTKLNCTKCGNIFCDHCVEFSKYNLNKDGYGQKMTDASHKFICQNCDSK